MESKRLVFEAAGWPNTGGGDVPNCRLRTRIRNDHGRLIYFEITGHETSKYTPGHLKGYSVLGSVSHCFYKDRPEDKKKNFSPELSYIENLSFEYDTKNILNLVNTHLNCSFTEFFLDDNVCVFDTEECMCSLFPAQSGKERNLFGE